MADITEIAVASWRLEKWLDNVNVERKMAAKSALRAIKKYLSENNIEIIDLTGAKFDVGLAITVVNNESDETDEDKLVISEMVKPIIKENGSVIQYGQVILGDEVKKPKENNVVEAAPPPEVTEAEKKVVEIAEVISTASENTQSENVTEETVESKEDKKTNERSKLGFCIIGLQIVLIAIALMLFVKVGNVISLNEQLIAAHTTNPPEVSESVPVDLSGVENGLKGIDERLDSVEGDISTLLEKYAVIEEALANQETTESDDDYIVYIVQPGDTLFKICQEHGIDFHANRALILRMNYMDDANVISIGQKLLLPKE